MTLKKRISALEGGSEWATYEERLDVVLKLERGEPVDWSRVKPMNPAHRAALEELAKGCGQ